MRIISDSENCNCSEQSMVGISLLI